jgi:hypothetical protein
VDQGVITFASLDRRVWRTPAEGCESASQIMGMILDTTCDQNQGTNPAERPPIRLKTGLPCSPPQDLQQVLPLAHGQARRTSRRWSVPQTLKVALASPQLLGPFADRRAADAHLARDGRVGKVASLQQSPGRQAAFLKWRASEMSWSPYHRHLL